MQVNISGKNINVGVALTSHVEEKIVESVYKYFENAVSSFIVFTKEKSAFRVEIRVNEGTGNHILLKSSGESSDAYSAFAEALSKVEKCLRRYKKKIRNHNKDKIDKSLISKYVLSGDENDDIKACEETGTPLVIAENDIYLEKISVSDAVMRLDFEDLPALIFINSRTSAINMVYKRTDGNISWVDSGVIKN